MAENLRLNENIKKFLDVYKILSPEARAAFEAELPSAIKGSDEKTKKLYEALLKAAKEGMDTEAAIGEMERTRKEGPNE